jgi:hypothetical protein
MSGFVAVTWREIAERRKILYAAAAAALIPLILPAIRRLSPNEVAEARGWTALMTATAFAVGLCIALGSSLLVPRIATRRIAFDLARPLSAAAIWFGSMAATAALALASAAIIWIPARLAGARNVAGELVKNPTLGRVTLLILFAALLVLFAVAHGGTLIVRSRSPWLAVDAILCAACILAIGATVSRLPERFALGPRLACLLGIAVVAGAAFVAGGYASIERGRTEAPAAHGALSTVLWAVLVPAVVAAYAYASWVMAASPGDLPASPGGFSVEPAASGPWVRAAGSARHADAYFLLDTASGRFVRAQTPDWREPALSRDGRRAAWIEAEERGGPYPVRMLHLDEPRAVPVVTRILMSTYPSLLVLSPDGSRLATWEQGILSIHDVDVQRTLASVKVPVGEKESLSGVFVGPDAFRLFRRGDRAVEILELGVATRSLKTRGRIEASAGLRFLSADPEGARLVTLEGAEPRARLYDAANGSLLASLADGPSDSRWPVFLPDRRIVVSEKNAKVRVLRVFGPDGSAQKTIELPAMDALSFGGEASPGLLCLGFGDATEGGAPFQYKAWLVGLDDGSLRKIADDLGPLHLRQATPDLGSEATKLFYGPGQRSLVRLDPVTGERRVVLGAP